ncbi:MAG: hypothetical protein JSR90_00370 [Proteobacteria bacterium]|nr:hypothetical protein [Pseudomonadota bacterium]
MLPGRKSEFISRFVGQLHIPLEAFGVEIDYGSAYERHGMAPTGALPVVAPMPLPVVEDLDTQGSPRPHDAPPDAWNLFGPEALSPSLPRAMLPALGTPPPLLPLSPAPHGGGGGGGGEDDVVRIDVSYQGSGDQMDLRVVQVNQLSSDDTVLNSDGQARAWPVHSGPDLATLEATAAHHIPHAYAHTMLTSPESIVATLTDLGNHVSGSPPATLTEGTVVDGRAVAPDASPPADPTTAIPAAPTDHHANMAVVETGGNLSANFAGVASETGATGTLVVLGDSYKSDAIIQTNVLVDHATVEGTAPTAALQTGGDAANNVAEFVHTLDQNPYSLGFFGGLHWHVDTLPGNYYNIDLVTQYNYLSDRDLVQQTATDHFKFVETGANEQGNQLVATNIDPVHYDLVVVTGNYYSTNWIFQTNVLLNNDYVSVDAGSGGAGHETVSTGANWLMNSAQIIDYSGPAQPMSSELQAIANALHNSDTSLDTSAGLAIPGNGSLDLNVLFINGNYYDLNVLQQTNVVNDSDTVMQTLANGESGYVATGGNNLSNQAILIDVGPTAGAFVGGHQYTEAVLVQTNIMTQSAAVSPAPDGIVTNNPQALAPEAAAIIQHDPGPSSASVDHPAPAPTTDAMSHPTPDPLSSVLS